jgi:hypothetical protein
MKADTCPEDKRQFFLFRDLSTFLDIATNVLAECSIGQAELIVILPTVHLRG